MTSSGSCNYANSAGSASSATTAETVSTSIAAGSTKAIVQCTIAESDAFRIMAGGETNEGWLEIATSDDANEHIYVRQYMHKGTDMFNSIARTLTLLDGSGNTQFPGTVTATTFTGNLTGNCSGSAGSVAWNNVSDKPTIPTNTSQLTNDSGFLTSHQDLSGYIPKSGGQVFTGSSYTRTVDDASLCICGGSDTTKGATLYLYGKDRGSQSGEVTLIARKSDETGVLFKLYPNGKMTWDNDLSFTRDTIAKTDDTWYTVIRGGTTHTSAYIMCYGISNSIRAGWVRLCPTSNREMNLKPDGTWTWDGTACQITSDQRLKQQIAEIDDKLLDAWEDVELSQFKYNDAVEQKGDNARLHTGYVVQQINDACQKHNIDISEYGLYCHEVYQEETEEVEVEQKDGTKVKERKVIREASEHYSLRYTEVYAVECMYLRRENKRLNDRLTVLEELFKQYIAK